MFEKSAKTEALQMNFLLMKTKVFAYFSMLFAISVSFACAQTSSVYDVPAGTLISVRMDNEINSKISSVSDTFTTTLAEPLIIHDVVVLPSGTIIEGKIERVKRAAIGSKNGNLIVSFEVLRLADGTKRAIEGVLAKELKANASPKTKTLTVLGAVAIGVIGGAASKAQNGALIGAGVGAGAGTIVALLQKGKDVSIQADQRFEIRLTKNIFLPPQDY